MCIHKELRTPVFGWCPFKKSRRRSVVFEISVQKLNAVASNPGIARVGIVQTVIGLLIFSETLCGLPALKHRAELGMRHTQHIDGQKIAVCPSVQNTWAEFIRRRILI